jgi:hypothetical protein
MRTAGIILFVLGLVGTIVFGIQALQQSESFSFLGIDIAVSSANWTPVIVSVIVLLAGVFMIGSSRTASSRR